MQRVESKIVQKPKEVLTLEEIARNYHFILFDTCALGLPSINNQFDNKRVMRTLKQSFNFLLDSPFISQFYITERVLSEVLPQDKAISYPNLDLSKFYSALRKKGREIDSTHSVNMKRFREFLNFKRNFASKFAGRAHVIDFANSGIYDLLFEGDSDCFENGTSEINRDFLIHGVILSYLSPIAIITGEKGIVISYYRMSRLSPFSFENFGCFVKTGENSFEERRPYVRVVPH